MKRHTKIYMKFFGFKVQEDCFCEIPDCGQPAVDINHIQCRGMGGNPKQDKDAIENLMAMCRKHHIIYGDVPGYKTWLQEVHKKFMKRKQD
jgi:hypothetical protein